MAVTLSPTTLPPVGAAAIEQFAVSGDKILTTVRGLVREGNVRRLTLVQEDGSTVLRVPLSVGPVRRAATVAMAPLLMLVGAITSVLSKITVVVERVATSLPTEALDS